MNAIFTIFLKVIALSSYMNIYFEPDHPSHLQYVVRTPPSV